MLTYPYEWLLRNDIDIKFLTIEKNKWTHHIQYLTRVISIINNKEMRSKYILMRKNGYNILFDINMMIYNKKFSLNIIYERDSKK